MVRNMKRIFYFKNVYLDKLILPYFTSNCQLSSDGSSVVSGKQQHYVPVKSYSDLLFDEGDLSLSTNSINEQSQPMLLID